MSTLKLPLRKFEHFRVSTQDDPPTPWKHHQQQELLQLERQHSNNDSSSSSVVCQVCQQHVSRYTCPRCQLLYCSVSCYQDHCSNNTDNEPSSCTEAFYYDRVQDILQLEQKAKTKDAHTLMRRMYQEQQNQQHEEDIGSDDEVDEEGMSEEEMSQLLEVLALLDETNSSDSDGQNNNIREQQLSSLLAKSPKLKAAFEQSLETGELQDLVLKPWSPWWLSSSSTLVSSIQQEAQQSNHQKVISSEEEQEEFDPDQSPTLDERLIKIPTLGSLQGGTTVKKPIPPLTYNLLEVLYRTVWILRLYHGVSNATTDGDTAVDAALTFLQASTVLSQDARYESLEEVLLAVTTIQEKSTAADGHNNNNNNSISWTLLAEDVAHLVRNPRFIGRALLEIVDILKMAISHLKKIQKQQQQQEESHIPDISEMRRKRKKVEFFLSWSQHPQATMPNSLSDDIRAWIECWKCPAAGDHGQEDERELETLLLPSSSTSSHKQQQPKQAYSSFSRSKQEQQSSCPWMIQEVQSTYSKTDRASPKIEVLD